MNAPRATQMEEHAEKGGESTMDRTQSSGQLEIDESELGQQSAGMG